MAVRKLNQDKLGEIGFGEMVRDTDVTGLIATRVKSGLRFKVQHDLRGRTVRMTLKTTDLREARRQARLIKNQISEGIDPRLPEPVAAPGPEAWTVREAMDRYIEKTTHKDDTRRGIREHLVYLTPLLNTRLADLTKSKCRAVHEAIPGKTVANTAFRYLRAAYNYVKKFDDHGRLVPKDENPATGVHWNKVNARDFEPWPLDEWSAALTTVAEPRRSFHLLMLLGGLRKSTCWATTWDMVDLSGCVIRYPGDVMKSDRDFHLPLSEPMVCLIEQLPRLHHHWLFPAISDSGHITEAREKVLGEGRTGHNLRKYHYTVGEALGIPEAHLAALHDHAAPGLKKNYLNRLGMFDDLLRHQKGLTASLLARGLAFD